MKLTILVLTLLLETTAAFAATTQINNSLSYQRQQAPGKWICSQNGTPYTMLDIELIDNWSFSVTNCELNHYQQTKKCNVIQGPLSYTLTNKGYSCFNESGYQYCDNGFIVSTGNTNTLYIKELPIFSEGGRILYTCKRSEEKIFSQCKGGSLEVRFTYATNILEKHIGLLGKNGIVGGNPDIQNYPYGCPKVVFHVDKNENLEAAKSYIYANVTEKDILIEFKVTGGIEW